MPITIKDYTWDETEKMLYITVPLKGVKPNRVDIFSTEEYIKVSYPPFIFDCALHAPVNDREGTVEINNGVVVFKLEKQTPGLWGVLHHLDKDDKEKLQKRREAAVLRGQERAAEEEKEKKERKREADKFSVNNQIRIEREEKQRIEDFKKSEREKATMELEEWKALQNKQQEAEKSLALQKSSRVEKSISFDEIIPSNGIGRITINDSTVSRESKKVKQKHVFKENAGGQEIRVVGKINVSFTQRDFLTAARESTSEMEQEWLKKQAEARRLSEIQDSELRDHERDPVWLKEKGDEFFKAENYHAAINAFSHAIRMNHRNPALHSNRAACHLKLGNYFKCAEDCSKALDLLQPAVAQNAASRMKAHVRRGTAYCHLELYVEGLQDYEAALKVDPHNDQLKSDADRIRQIIQGSQS